MTYTREQVEQADADWVRALIDNIRWWELNSRDWPRDIAAAWELVTEARDRNGCSFWLEDADDFEPWPPGWKCSFGEATATAPTAPLAICKAYLLWWLENQPSVPNAPSTPSTARTERTAVLLRHGKVGLVVEGRRLIGKPLGEGDAYFYNEHTCPTNYMPKVVAVVDLETGDDDPHGIFEYAATAAWPEEESVPMPGDTVGE